MVIVGPELLKSLATNFEAILMQIFDKVIVIHRLTKDFQCFSRVSLSSEFAAKRNFCAEQDANSKRVLHVLFCQILHGN